MEAPPEVSLEPVSDGRSGPGLVTLLGAWIVVIVGAWLAGRWAGRWSMHAAALPMLALPIVLGREPLASLGLSPRKIVYGLVEAAVVAAVLITPFLLAARFMGYLDLESLTAEKVIANLPLTLLLVALPEEFFFRAFLQRGLDDLRPGRAKVLGVRCGLGLPAAAALFALAHLAALASPMHLLVFFPALVFGWLYARRGSIIGPVVFHAACNLSLLACPGLPFGPPGAI